jgi:hypothetical protein
LTTYTITVEPTVAASTVSLKYSTQYTGYAVKIEGAGDYSYDQAISTVNITHATTVSSNAVSVFNTSTAASGGYTNSSWPSAYITTETVTYEYDEGTSSFEVTSILTSSAWELIGTSPAGAPVDGLSVTQSWDGQFTSSDSSGSTTAASSTTTTFEAETTTIETTIAYGTFTDTGEESCVVGTYVSSSASTTNTTRSVQIVSIQTSEQTKTIVTTASGSVAAYDGNTGSRGVATVFLLEPHEAIWVPTATGMGNNLSDFAFSVTDSVFTLNENIITASAVTAELGASAVYDETTIVETSTVSTLTATTITLTPSSASVIPQTTTQSIQSVTTESVTSEIYLQTENAHTPTVTRPTWKSSTTSASFGTMSWQAVYSRSLSSFTTSSAELLGQSTNSGTQTASTPIAEDEASSNGSTTELGTTSRELTFSQTVPAKISALQVNAPYRTASSFYQARAALANISSIARNAFAQGITFKPFSEQKAAQTAILQNPMMWTYTSEASSVTASAWGGGLTISVLDNTEASASVTTKSGPWNAGGDAIKTQSTSTMLNPVLGAPTGTAVFFDMPGTKFTTIGTNSGTIEIVTPTTASELSVRAAQSVAPIWIVGDENGQRWLTTQRNLSSLPPVSSAF